VPRRSPEAPPYVPGDFCMQALTWTMQALAAGRVAKRKARISDDEDDEEVLPVATELSLHDILHPPTPIPERLADWLRETSTPANAQVCSV
jgi:hypothetical protein